MDGGSGSGSGGVGACVGQLNYVSAACLTLGRAHLALGSRERGAAWLVWALQADPMCVAALDELSDRMLLTQAQEAQLLESLDWRECEGGGDDGATPPGGWLGDYYALRLCRYDSGVSVGERVRPLRDAGLADNSDVMTAVAQLLHAQHQPAQAAATAARVRSASPHDSRVMPVHLSSMCLAGDVNELFLCAHQLVCRCRRGLCCDVCVCS